MPRRRRSVLAGIHQTRRSIHGRCHTSAQSHSGLFPLGLSVSNTQSRVHLGEGFAVEILASHAPRRCGIRPLHGQIEAQCLLEVPHAPRVLPVECRLLHCEDVQIPLAVGHALPGRPRTATASRSRQSPCSPRLRGRCSGRVRRAGSAVSAWNHSCMFDSGSARCRRRSSCHARSAVTSSSKSSKRPDVEIAIAVVDHIIAAICKLGPGRTGRARWHPRQRCLRYGTCS